MSWKLFVPVETEVTEINKDGNKSVVTISSKMKFIDIAIFMAASLSDHVDTRFLYKKTFLKKMSLKNHKPLRKY